MGAAARRHVARASETLESSYSVMTWMEQSSTYTGRRFCGWLPDYYQIRPPRHGESRNEKSRDRPPLCAADHCVCWVTTAGTSIAGLKGSHSTINVLSCAEAAAIGCFQLKTAPSLQPQSLNSGDDSSATGPDPSPHPFNNRWTYKQ